MFTGIVEEIGQVVSLTRVPDVVLWDGSVGEGWVLVVSCAVCLEGATLGCSIAVNGTCLTATALTPSTFTVGCAPETMRLTNLCDLQAGSPVNLERSARVDSRISGHYVQGHVDNTGAVAATWVEGDSLWVRVAAPAALLRYIVPKGYIACDGASLTVCEVVPPEQGSATGSFTFMLIAYTQKHITLPLKKVGDRVNLEVDVQGKLAERAVGGVMAALGDLEARLMAALGKLEGRVGALEAKVEKL